MGEDAQIAVANPAWDPEAARRESQEVRGDFAVGFGFSDQVFLARRSEFARPIYHRWHLESTRYPLYEIAPTFEARVDAYLRTEGRLRATHLGSRHRHVGPTGTAYPESRRIERWRRRWWRWRRRGL